MKMSESIVELAKALAAFQGEVKQPAKSADNPFFKSKYVPLEDVVEAIHAASAKNGLSFTQWALVNEQNRIGVATLLLHSSGEWIEYDAIFMKSEKDTAQGAGSVISYLKRYALSAVFGITSDLDDDGNGASQKSQDAYKKPAYNNTPPAGNSNMISPAQINALKAKLSNISKDTQQEPAVIYASATKHFSINKTTKELTKGEASKIIDYLGTLEG